MKYLVSCLVLAVLVLSLSCETGEKGSQVLRGKKVAMIIAHRWFRDEELLKPKEILEEQGAKVLTISSSSREAMGMLGAKVRPDLVLDQLNVADFDAIVFVGGKGAKEYWDDSLAHAIARRTLEQEKILAAICMAPVTLARAGVLEGRNATVWVTEREKLEEKGAILSNEGVTVDGNIVTGYGPVSVEDFTRAIVEKLHEE